MCRALDVGGQTKRIAELEEEHGDYEQVRKGLCELLADSISTPGALLDAVSREFDGFERRIAELEAERDAWKASAMAWARECGFGGGPENVLDEGMR